MDYSFSPELNQLIQEGLASGDYVSEDSMLLEAVRLLRECDRREQDFRAQLQARIDRLDRGEGVVLEDEAELRRFFDDVQSRGMQRYRDKNRAS